MVQEALSSQSSKRDTGSRGCIDQLSVTQAQLSEAATCCGLEPPSQSRQKSESRTGPCRPLWKLTQGRVEPGAKSQQSAGKSWGNSGKQLKTLAGGGPTTSQSRGRIGHLVRCSSQVNPTNLRLGWGQLQKLSCHLFQEMTRVGLVTGWEAEDRHWKNTRRNPSTDKLRIR